MIARHAPIAITVKRFAPLGLLAGLGLLGGAAADPAFAVAGGLFAGLALIAYAIAFGPDALARAIAPGRALQILAGAITAAFGAIAWDAADGGPILGFRALAAANVAQVGAKPALILFGLALALIAASAVILLYYSMAARGAFLDADLSESDPDA